MTLIEEVQKLLGELRLETGVDRTELQVQLNNLMTSMFLFADNPGVAEAISKITEPAEMAAMLDAVNEAGVAAAKIGWIRRLAGKVGQLAGNVIISYLVTRLEGGNGS